MNTESIRGGRGDKNILGWVSPNRGSKNPGLDPSELGSGWSGGSYASEGGQLPSARSFGLNVSLKF